MAKNANAGTETDGETRETKDYAHVGQQWGIFGATPSTQPTAVGDASGGATVDAEARTAINDLLARLRTLGIIAT